MIVEVMDQDEVDKRSGGVGSKDRVEQSDVSDLIIFKFYI